MKKRRSEPVDLMPCTASRANILCSSDQLVGTSVKIDTDSMHPLVLHHRVGRDVVVDYVCDMCLVTSIPVTDTFSDSATELESIKMVGERWFCKECSSDICLKCAPKVIAIQSYAVGFKHSKGRWTKMVEEDWFEEFQSMGIPFCDIDRLMWAASGTIADALTMWQKEKEASNQAQKEMDAAIAALADPFGNDEVGGGDY